MHSEPSALRVDSDAQEWKQRLEELSEMLPASRRDVDVTSRRAAVVRPPLSTTTAPFGTLPRDIPMLEDDGRHDTRAQRLLRDEAEGAATAESAVRHDNTAMPPASSSARLFMHMEKSDEDLATREGRLDELHAYQQSHFRWRAYRTFCQFRFGYLAFLVLMVIIMFSFTLLMEIFFAIFLPSAKYDEYYIPRSIALLVALPVVLFFLSYFFEEATRFFSDAIDKTDGALPNFRLALAVVIHYLRHRKEMEDPRIVGRRRDSNGTPVSTGNNGANNSNASDHAGAGGGGLRSTLLLAAKDDPFLNTSKDDDEDDAWMRQQELEELAEAEAAAAHVTATGAAARVNRWKRVKAAVTATLLIRKVAYEGPPFDVSTFVAVDVFCPVLFELVTAIALISEFFSSWSPAKAFAAYVQLGFWTLSLYLLVWVGTHFWSSRNRKMRVLVSNYRRRRRLMRRAVNELERHKRADHLWLLDVGFRFYYHVAQKANVAAWWRARADSRRRTNSTDNDAASAHVETDGTLRSDDDAVSINIQTGDSGNKRRRHTQTLAAVAGRMQAATERARSRNPWRKLSYSWKAGILLVLVIGAAVVSFYSFFLGWPLMGLLLIAFSRVIQRRFPQIFGRAFRHFIVAFVALSLVFFSSTILIGTFVSGGSFQLGPFQNATESATAGVAVNGTTTSAAATITTVRSASTLGGFAQTSEYPACTIDYDGLTVLDFALLADAAYGNTTAAHKRALTNRFNGTTLSDWTYVTRNNESTDHQVWYELYFPSINMTVVAVRGTASAADALEDLHYWFGITIMQAIDVFVPFLKQLPRAFVIKLLSMDLITRGMPAPVYIPLLKHVEQVRARVGDNVVLTGHSLGGAMAAMVGAKTQTRAVSFSGPGLLYSRGRFGIEANDVRDFVLTFKPRKDIVPRVDELGGMVQELRCKQRSPMACHSSVTHMCELYLSCGDTRGRNWAVNKQCLAYEALPDDVEDDA